MEKILNYTWDKFIGSPFSALFIALCILVGYLVHTERENMYAENLKYEQALEKCSEARLKDRENYIKLLEKLKVNKELNDKDNE